MENKLTEALKAAIDSGSEVSTNTKGSSLRETNQKRMKHVLYQSEEVKALRETMQRKFGFDMFDNKAFPVQEWNFSWKKLRQKLEEADSGSTFVQFLRAGIQNITSAMYESVQTSYEDWVTVVPSARDTELYAPNHGVAFPRQIPEQTKYPEVGAAALDIKLRNYKYGSVYSVTHELIEDDQTGSFQRQAGMLGEYLRLLCEVLVYGKLASVANMQYIDFQIPQSETQPSYETPYPWSTALRGGGANRPSAYGTLTQANIQEGIIALMNQKNLQGIKMQVSPTRLLISPKNKFDAYVLLNSAYYPSGAAAAGAVGGAFAVNPLKSILDITVSRFMFDHLGSASGNSKAWYIVDDSKPWFVLQQREAIAVVQENPQSGRSFDEDVIRFKARSRQNADHLDPRFAWQGNDGSV
jgi:actin-related protein